MLSVRRSIHGHAGQIVAAPRSRARVAVVHCRVSRGVAGASGVVEREMVLGHALAQRSFGPVSCDSARRATGEGEGERCRVDRDVSVHAARTHAGMLAA